MLEKTQFGSYAMGVDTGKLLHVVILKNAPYNESRVLVHLAICKDFEDLDALMTAFPVARCVIDGLPETHATRAFAKRHLRNVYLSFFNEHQRGAPKWDEEGQIVQVNRTEALDASRAAVREKKIVLPRCTSLVERFAHHMAADAKVLDEDETTGIKKYRYVKTGENHFSLAFTYAWLAAKDQLRPLSLDDVVIAPEPSWLHDSGLWLCPDEFDQHWM